MDASKEDERIDVGSQGGGEVVWPRRVPAGRKTRARLGGRPPPRVGSKFSRLLPQKSFFHLGPLEEFVFAVRHPLRARG
jgi:hypothetical protein